MAIDDQTDDLNQQLKQLCENMQTLEQMSATFSDFYFDLMDLPDDSENVMNKLDANVTCSVANASLYGLYLTLKGTELGDHPIKDELGRVRKYYQELELLKKSAPKLNLKAAQNFIRNALWDPTNDPPPENIRPKTESLAQQQHQYQQKSNYYNNNRSGTSKAAYNNKRKRR
ncbi:PREDICTED: nuclear nucleic acid-binding protein C1D-like [Rhagoletis zephyria]|uniref:nuclear nucleic acid-binding protein C1D-like n=1 Tax=Rhagoletis zephyria TaxID=28612 RepID=UPI0008112D01|nr:PREDICTED: nuclear nucleic acid-binding protein C1D-like [Rhagoletis zephyria]KAH9394497.1 DNA-binding protein c1d [Tyrophagus putrescentiae]